MSSSPEFTRPSATSHNVSPNHNNELSFTHTNQDIQQNRGHHRELTLDDLRHNSNNPVIPGTATFEQAQQSSFLPD